MKKFLYIIFCAFACFFIFPDLSQAASALLYFSPASKTVSIGSQFSVAVYVSSPDQAINAVSGSVDFPNDKLEVISLSKSESILTLWAQEPSFLNQNGSIDFEGIIMNPGFTGSAGKIITIIFKAKAIGNAEISFPIGSVLANDGKGTNILSDFGSAAFSITNTAVSEPSSKIEPLIQNQSSSVSLSPSSGALPLSPVISSITHPDQNKWYNNNNPKFSWPVPQDVDWVRIQYDKSPYSKPTFLYKTPLSEKQLNDISDGIWYFYVQLHNQNGWGSIAKYCFKIDTKEPNLFSIKFIDGIETKNPRPTVVFNTTDDLSGIKNYWIKIGEEQPFSISASSTVADNPFVLPSQQLGKHMILVQAFDNAGNYTSVSTEFYIEPLTTPVITEYPKQLNIGEKLIIKGATSYPDSRVIIWIQKEKQEIQENVVNCDKDGNFIFSVEKGLEEGNYRLRAVVTGNNGEKSNLSEETVISVTSPMFFKIGYSAMKILGIAVPIIIFLMIVVLIIYYSIFKLRKLRKKLGQGISKTEKTLKKTFGNLKEEVLEQIKFLEKTRKSREFTEEEELVLSQLKRSLDSAEGSIKKEIDEIEKL